MEHPQLHLSSSNRCYPSHPSCPLARTRAALDPAGCTHTQRPQALRKEEHANLWQLSTRSTLARLDLQTLPAPPRGHTGNAPPSAEQDQLNTHAYWRDGRALTDEKGTPYPPLLNAG